MAGIIESFVDAVVDLHNSLTRKIFFVIILEKKKKKQTKVQKERLAQVTGLTTGQAAITPSCAFPHI